MKKLLPLLLALFSTVSLCAACEFGSFLPTDSSQSSTEDTASGCSIVSDSSLQESVQSSSSSSSSSSQQHTYTAFTSSEKALFNSYFGEVIPFVANDEYYVEEYEYEEEIGINFYTLGNTKAEFNAYLDILNTKYTSAGTVVDDYGDTWYFFDGDGYYVDASYYYYDEFEAYLIDVYAYTLSESSNSGNSSSGNTQTDALSILQAAYALNSGSSLSGTYELTGVVTNVEKTGSGDICLTFVVGNYTQYPMYCYWLQDADFLKVGDTITVSGTIKKFNNLVEFDHPELVSYQSASGGGSSSSYQFTAFTSTEKSLFNSYFSEVIPFVANNEYYVEEYEYEEEIGINFYTLGNTKSEFNAYLDALDAKYQYVGEEVDHEGDTWYFYDSEYFYIDVAYYYYSEPSAYIIDVYVYTLGKNNGNNGNNGNTGNGNTSLPSTLMTNDGKGLPTGTNGVDNVDFTKAQYVKNVTQQSLYLDGCPTVGSPKVLVIPVQFKDVTAQSKGYSIATIENAFNGTNTDYYSVYEYYYKSSYGKLSIDFDVWNEWFTPAQNSSYYIQATMDYDGSQMECGDFLVIDEALRYLSGKMDLSVYDSDNNGFIDAVVIINTLEINADVDLQWAYRYWNFYTDSDGYYYEYDGVCANDYMWASYQFLYEDEYGYEARDAVNTYTFIHEFGHVLGAEDYYDTAYKGSPMGGNDLMDNEAGDHNAYTKFNYGWLTSSRLVTASDSVTLTLDAFEKNGDTIIIANNWDDKLGVYQEYFIVVYYTNDGLNGDGFGYFDEEGIVVYHVNASLQSEVYDAITYYSLYFNNTDVSDPYGYGTVYNLIELVSQGLGEYVYGVGDSLSQNVTLCNGDKIAYTFSVSSMDGETATLVFTKNS